MSGKKEFRHTKLGLFFLGNNNLSNPDKEIRMREYELQKRNFHRKLKSLWFSLLLGVVYFLLLKLMK
tara:strand:- start:180 stop:380 length:201 start_codon:yes stop_codon:yes gene_type:complete